MASPKACYLSKNEVLEENHFRQRNSTDKVPKSGVSSLFKEPACPERGALGTESWVQTWGDGWVLFEEHWGALAEFPAGHGKRHGLCANSPGAHAPTDDQRGPSR